MITMKALFDSSGYSWKEQKLAREPTRFFISIEIQGEANKPLWKILLTVSLQGKGCASLVNHKNSPNSTNAVVDSRDLDGLHISCKATYDKMGRGKQLLKVIANGLQRIFKKKEGNKKSGDSSELSTTLSDYEDIVQESSSPCSFEEAIALMQSGDNKPEMPENLAGAATKLINAAIEEQTYIRVSRKEFAILVRVSTPEVPYGNTFRIELLYKIMTGGEVSSGEESSHLVVS
ncbi:hypothetical protein VNO78_20841 [Psophocarpus tetragonolobus]|uniref:VASt domain-containing protein n=1 Tax=Psophocarpus tetragonolobus TaxID=3891 RepID=A0AAN9SAJ6_PSOTE